MLPKTKRLNLKKDFKFVASGKKIYTESFNLFLKPGNNKYPLIGIALSKGQFRKAHEKNKAKRLASKAAEMIYSRLITNLNLVIMPKAVIFNKKVDQLKEELENVKDLFCHN